MYTYRIQTTRRFKVVFSAYNKEPPNPNVKP